jgi:AcrR family transcriptional regulator
MSSRVTSTSAEPGPAAAETGRDRARAAQRDAIEAAALLLLDRDGPAAVTTRAVSAEAGVQPMTIYRIFGDMDRLLESAASRGFAEYVAAKTARPAAADPVDDLREGWDLHVEFGLAHPHVYAQTYGRYVPGPPAPAVRAAADVLRGLVERAAKAGRLTRDVESAAQIIHSAGCGVTLTLMQLPEEDRDLSVSVACREAVLASVTTAAPTPQDGAGPHAVALSSLVADGDDRFTAAELGLLQEWLSRLSTPGSPPDRARHDA